MKIAHALIAGLTLAAATAAPLVGCGDDDNPVNPPVDSGGGNDATNDTGGNPDTGTDGGTPRTPVMAKGPSNGSSVALSPDESKLVVANRDKGSVTVFNIAYAAGAAPTLTKAAELDLGAGSEPWQVTIDPKGDRAYVALRQSQKLSRIDNLDKATPTKGPEVAVGSEPTAVALSPFGTRAYVSNFVDGTVSVVDTEKMTVAKTIDLNKAIVNLLGSGLTARPAMAHPRSLAVSNNGNTDENDEFLYATEFYGVRKDPEAADGSNADTSKRGVVYRVKLSNDNLETIDLAPLADMGFPATPTVGAGCYPNALQSITLNGKYAYVVSVCASPRGPSGVRQTNLDCPSGPGATGNDECNAAGTQEGACQASNNFGANKCNDLASVKTSTAPLLSVVDTSTDPPTEVSAARASLNQKWFARYASNGVSNDGARRLPLFANDLTFVPGQPIGYVSANGTNAVFRLTFKTDGTIDQIGGSTTQNFIDLTNGQAQDFTNAKHGLLPTGVVAGSKNFMFVANDVSRNVSVVDLGAQAVAGSGNAVFESSAKASSETSVLKGRLFFNTGLGRWSLRGQGWGACQSCHPDGLSDNVTWYFGRGPRQSTSLDGSFSADGTVQRIFNWTAVFDEVADFEGNTRGVSGGVGAIVKTLTSPPANGDRLDQVTALSPDRHDGLNGSATLFADKTNPLSIPAPGSQLDDWADVTNYIKTIRSPRGSKAVDATKVAAGKTLFLTHKCNGCHGGKLWTISELFYTRNAGNAFSVTEGLKSSAWTVTSGATAFKNFSPTGNETGTMRDAPDNNNDTITCTLRDVKTFGVSEADVSATFPELRQDMVTPGQGGGAVGPSGFSPPSLLGLVLAGPLLHGGQARTLEALFSDTFASHHRALSTNFLVGGNATERDQLIHFLLSIDDSTTVINPPATPSGTEGGKVCAP